MGSIFTAWWLITIMAVAEAADILLLAWQVWKYYKKTKRKDSAVHVQPPEPPASEHRPIVQSVTTSARPRARRQRKGEV